MNILLYNESWMTYNVALALIAVLAGWLLLFIPKKPIFFIICLGIWFFFLPNTIYIITDLEHLIRQVHLVTAVNSRLLLIIEYLIFIAIGLVSYVLALYPVEQLLLKTILKRKKNLDTFLLVLLNFLIGFGITLGRIERVNSWWVITKTSTVFSSIFTLFSSPNQLVLVILFGLFANLFYFLFKDPLIFALYKITKYKKLKSR